MPQGGGFHGLGRAPGLGDLPGPLPSFPPSIGLAGNVLQLLSDNSGLAPAGINLTGFSLSPLPPIRARSRCRAC